MRVCEQFEPCQSLVQSGHPLAVVCRRCGHRAFAESGEVARGDAVAHGVGNALYEWMGYDENAQPVTTNLGEYLLVTATEMPRVEIIHQESPSPLNPLGVKGVGECGVVPAPAAIISATKARWHFVWSRSKQSRQARADRAAAIACASSARGWSPTPAGACSTNRWCRRARAP